MHNGTVTGSNPTKAGRFGGGFEFNGEPNTDYIVVGTGSNFSDVCLNGCTFSGWGYSLSSLSETIIGRRDGTGDNYFFRLSVQNDDDASFVVYKNGSQSVFCEAVSSGEFTDNEWHHAVGVYNLTNISIYVDGQIKIILLEIVMKLVSFVKAMVIVYVMK